MPVLRVYADTVGRGTCRSCGRPITWAELVSGKRMPFDAGELVPVRIEGALFEHERVVWHLDTELNATHFQTCPHAALHRRR